MKKKYFLLETKKSGYATRLYVNGELVEACGDEDVYDWAGVCMGQWITKNFQKELKKFIEIEDNDAIQKSAETGQVQYECGGLLGLNMVVRNGDMDVWIDGECGLNQIMRIVKISGIGGGY
jgi:hypothetical protein